jgi:aminoglycoside phosphotransferase (APT) family kinase protein
MTENNNEVKPPGELPDITVLYNYLQANFGALAPLDRLKIEKFPAGASNLTFSVQWGDKNWVLRRPPIGANVKSGHDMEREFKVLSGLIPLYPKVPRPISYCGDVSVLGAPFYIMERVDGLILRNPAPSGLTPAVLEQASKSLIANLAAIHGLDYTQTDLKQFARGSGYTERQISGWAQRYDKAKTDDVPAMAQLARWLDEHKLADVGSCLIHNDYRYDNTILDPANLGKVIAVLDWEMATIGDPLMDLGTTLAYWVDPDDGEELHLSQHGITNLPGNLNREGLVHYYALQSGLNMDNAVFYYAYGLFKLAVIVQQIYYRYKLGYTKDERFARYGNAVKNLASVGVRAIEIATFGVKKEGNYSGAYSNL